MVSKEQKNKEQKNKEQKAMSFIFPQGQSVNISMDYLALNLNTISLSNTSSS